MDAEARFSSPTPALSIFSFGRAEFDEQRRELRVDGRAVPMETKPYDLLRVFLHHPGETLSKDELIEAVWPGRIVTEGVLAKCVTKLRGALGDDEQQVIRTVHGYGYRFVASLSMRTAAGGSASPTPRAGDALPARPHWHLVRELGHGGFGSVWLVEHEKTRERRVFKFAGDGAALQALKREITLFRLLRDSLGERAAIVRILDWNVDEPPYFIEAGYIAGGNLIDWCEAQGGIASISRAVRIELIARVADALAAAHAIGVLHKDLKPANVLIAGDTSSDPEVRLGDFGSGRALEPERLAALGITRLGMTENRDDDTTSGTLFYLAPELIADGTATVGADIYALGVMLYQIVVADFRRPLAPGWEREIDDELLREDISAAADLDPSRRLADVGELARRLRTLPERARTRADERAALAHANEAREQVARWRTRRRWLVALCGVLAVASVVAVTLYLRAEREAAMTRAVNAFLNDDLLAAANPYSNREPDLRVREVLDRASAAVGERFAGRPAEEAAIRTTLGRTYAGIGDYGETRRQLSRALELVSAKGDDALQLRRALADNDVEDTHYDDAERAYATLAPDIVAAHGADSEEAMTLEAARGRLAERRGKHEDAVKIFEAGLPRWRAKLGDDADIVLDATADLGQAYRNMARFDDAEAKFMAVHDADTARFGATHWRTLQALQDLAQLERARGHLDRAVEIEREVLAGREKAFGRTHEETQNALNELASMLQDQQKYAEAEPIFREVLATREKTLGERHERTRNAMNNLALVLSDEGRLDESEALYQRALAIERELLGPDDLDVLILEHNLAGLERDRGDFAKSETLSRDVVERASRTLPAGRPETGLFLTGLGRTQQKQKHYEDAAATFTKARTILVGAYGPTHARVTKLTEMQTALYKEWGRPLPAELQ
ncbi:MAG TPA: tetratricopeptide repeat protein [Rhodanobacteraceae bacterium]|nr:tetratricopeptide repeat protein [Rhodanobacteraceae bacterium]